MSLPSISPDHLSPEAGRFTLLSLKDEVRRMRPRLVPESPEFQAAVLLLALREIGFNVHRLALRTGLPREFVARCLRRLAENGLWVGGHLRFTWVAERAESSHFWLDVDVALGRKLRRVAASGAPEWAPAGSWIKNFEQEGRAGEHGDVHALYHDLPNRDPASELGESEEREPSRAAPKPMGPPNEGGGRGWPGRRESAMMTREWREAQWLGLRS